MGVVLIDDKLRSKYYLFRRYRNRKLYNSVERKLTNLDDILYQIKKGKNIIVIDYNSKDVTTKILNDAYHKNISELVKKVSDRKKLNLNIMLNEAIRKLK